MPQPVTFRGQADPSCVAMATAASALRHFEGENSWPDSCITQGQANTAALREAIMQDETTHHHARGFAGMDQAKQREIASKGGRVAHQKRTAHEFSSEEARRAGHLGGLSVSRDRAHMAAIG